MDNIWFVRHGEPTNPTATLYMLPFAGGNAGLYADWADEIPDVSVVGVQYPGRGSRFMEPCISDAGTMAGHLARLIEDEADRHFFMFGYSMGAILAFETLVASSPLVRQRCLGLFVAARAAPGHQRRTAALHELDDPNFIEGLRELAGGPEEVLADKDLMSLLMPMLRSDFRLSERYQLTHKVILPIPITALCGENDPLADKDATLGWSQYTSRNFQYDTFPGGHFFINEHKIRLKAIVRNIIKERLSVVHTYNL
jgi:surfactin synthase thioesterase subunit